MLTKEAAHEALAAVGPTLRALVTERDALVEKVASYEAQKVSTELAEEVVDMMDKRNLGEAGMARKEKVAALLDSGRDLTVL